MKLVWNKEEDCAALTITPEERVVIFEALADRKRTLEKRISLISDTEDDVSAWMDHDDLIIIKKALKLL